MTNQNFVKTRYERVLEYDVPANQLTVREARKIPNVPNDVAYNEIVKMNLSIIYADIRGYTERMENADPKVAARIMSIYITEMAAAMRFHEGTIVSIEGDGIIGAFQPSSNNNASTKAVRTIVTMNTILSYVINKRLKSFQQDPISCGYGADYGRVYITRAGIRGEGKNELIYVGPIMSRVAKYQNLAEGNEVKISQRLYNGLEDHYKNNWKWKSVSTKYGTLYSMSVNTWKGTEEP